MPILQLSRSLLGFPTLNSAKRSGSYRVLVPLMLLTTVAVACDPMPVTVRVLYGRGGKGDRALNDAAYSGVLEAQDKTGSTILQLTPTSTDEMGQYFAQTVATAHATQDELIVVVSDEYAGIIKSSDCHFGKRKVLHVDGDDTTCSNVTSRRYRTYAAAFQAGVAAITASTSHGLNKNKSAIAIGGAATETVREAIDGFAAGVEHAGGTIVKSYMHTNLDGFNAPEHGQEKAEAYFGSATNPDVVFAAAGGTNRGILEACKEHNRLFIGFESDTSDYGPDTVIGSVVKHVNIALSQAIIDFYNGDLKSGHQVLGVAEGATAFVAGSGVSFSTELQSAADGAKSAAVAAESTYVGGE